MTKLAIHGGMPVRNKKKSTQPYISSEAKAEVNKALDLGYLARFYGGVYVHQFEAEYAEHFNREYGIAVNSGTAALHIAYLGAELPP
ncbi:DegT/DnrJ/EryC1/StrS family aminotransferase [Paenibacillus sp. FSL H8-0537]|uniref:DegT/DnrJ/EryC1/StrS family aminotransferase n=1 Tax=Paenibacillus sp. FSL H8-0537 TaxID=2921399 RepID=UPI003100C3D4